jgi:hypothetical protein
VRFSDEELTTMMAVLRFRGLRELRAPAR